MYINGMVLLCIIGAWVVIALIVALATNNVP